ncbi:MAG: NAD/NADP octopine/nopaline dehydrogenase family protein, partial [Candidatus Hodarchaeales archaeon]
DTQVARDWLCDAYGGSPAPTLYEGFRSIETYDGIGAPATLNHRYIFEDVPTGLVPLSSFGRIVGVPTPVIDSMVNLISAFFNIDFWLEGRTASQLGIADMTAEAIISYVETGLKQPGHILSDNLRWNAMSKAFPKPGMTVLGSAIGSCVHVAGVVNFLRLAEELGYKTIFLGPANSVSKVIDTIEKHKPDIVAVSYRLSPQSLIPVLDQLQERILNLEKLRPKIWLFGGTPPACEVAQKYSFFERFFDSSTLPTDVIDYLRGWTDNSGERAYPITLLDRLEFRRPYPILRAHFGLPSLEETLVGIREISLARCLDVISIGPDQNFQESFFRPEEMTLETGAGGVPIRSQKHLAMLRNHTMCGNYPLLRCYSGTRDLIKMAALLNETIQNAWGATPLMWYSELDGRSSRPLKQAIRENQRVMQWHGERDIPFECNEPHHWSLRDAPDSIAVAMAFLGAYNAKTAGIQTYIAQYMLNTPMQTSPRMDLAKMLAKIELIESLHSPATCLPLELNLRHLFKLECNSTRILFM